MNDKEETRNNALEALTGAVHNLTTWVERLHLSVQALTSTEDARREQEEQKKWDAQGKET